jgi:hypothetical protein
MKTVLLNFANGLLSKEQMRGFKGGYPIGSGTRGWGGLGGTNGGGISIETMCWQGPPGTTIFGPSNASNCNSQYSSMGGCTQVSCGNGYS